VSVKLDTKVLDALVSNADMTAEQANSQTAFAIAGKAAMNAPYLTGALSAGITAEPEEVFLATGATPGAWVARDSVNYGIYNETGTYKMAAHPFMVPAVESERQAHIQRLAKVAKP
jgi:HK97 gp10 family phage protein